MSFIPQRRKPHAYDRLVQFLPEDQILFVVRVRAAVGRDVELSQGWRVFLQGPFRYYKTVAVVVDVREADPVLALSKEIDFKKELELI